VHVDFETQKRTLKDSARFYAGVIASRGGTLRTPA
jgi:beta-glucosidase/6-phospho-beta-glucosidase/beta-galactosidase